MIKTISSDEVFLAMYDFLNLTKEQISKKTQKTSMTKGEIEEIRVMIRGLKILEGVYYEELYQKLMRDEIPFVKEYPEKINIDKIRARVIRKNTSETLPDI